MKTSFTENRLILLFVLLFAMSSLYLFWQNERGLDQNLGKDWWILSFDEPMNEGSLTYTVENHSNNTEFRATITEGSTLLTEETFSLPKGQSKTLTPTVSSSASRTVITVTTGTQKKAIYR